MQKLVVFTGSGISAESGIKTFRESGGLWEEYDISQVATPEAWERNPTLVQDFYNKRRKQILEATPNAAHIALTALENYYETTIITQNIDNLHERAGSKKVLHLHGQITQARSCIDPALIYEIEGWELKMDDRCSYGHTLRPNIVWFGEAVPAMEHAIMKVMVADIFIVIGTSLEVYPAASLVNFVRPEASVFLIDPGAKQIASLPAMVTIREKAGKAVPELVAQLTQ